MGNTLFSLLQATATRSDGLSATLVATSIYPIWTELAGPAINMFLDAAHSER
jgi:hypothetical protein